jgi:TP901 family phage tail tape measure protein
MADVNANIGVNIDTSDALNQLKSLQRQISAFHQSVAKSSSAASIAQRDLQKNFINGVNAIQGFSAELRTVRTSAETFTNSLEKNKFSIQQYFRYAASQTKTFGKNFTSEFSTIEKTAIERVKTLQTQYVKMGRDAQGAMQAIAIRPTVLNMKDLGTQTAIAAQKQVIFNQLIKQGSTNLLNFGKNTQWAGRQLMVGFTLPLATLGITAGRVFMDMEKAALKFKKVYGDLFTAPGETDKALDSIMELGLAYTKYGVAVSDSLEVASEAAAAGFQGVDLQNQTTAALKLSVLGQMELQKALETTIALQNAFNISSKDLAGEIDFLNAVENQTVVSLDDITEAVPRVAPVIQSLGGDVRDLAFFLAAMKEGGINAAQGANALKSGLASLINPAASATQFLGQLGIDLRGIVSRNKGDISGTIVEFAKALDTLDPQRRAQAIEQLFGKFQFARMSALFDNVIKDGSQASRVLDLAGSSIGDLADLSNKELGVTAASAANKFKAAIEQLKVALAPLGELFLKIATPFIDFATTVLKAFNSLPDGMKQIIGTVITVVGGLGPVLLMTFGLINNGIANMIKFFATVRLGYLKMTGQAKGIGDETQYMTQEQLEAAAAAASLDQAHAGLTQRFTAEKTAVDQLRIAYEAAAAAGARFAMLNPGMMKPGFVAAPTKMAKGGVVTVGGRGNKDTEPALLTPGEAVIPAEMVKKYAPLIEGMIAGNIPGYAKGVMLGMPKSAKSVSKNRDAAEEVYQMFLKSSYAGTAPTNYGHQISPTSGHSFPIFGLGGVYQKGNKQVFVKPVLDEKAALAEMRSTEISRRAHGLEAPEQRIVVIKDPMDVKGVRRFLALESDLDPKFVNNQPMGVFNEEQYFRQLVASLLRVDKDLSGSNVYGNVVADAGPSGVFSRASGLRDYEKNLPSMEEQAIVNLLGIKGGAKRAFAESTLGLMAGLTPEQYKARMLGEIQKVLPRLKETIASFKLTNPTEVGVYDDMVRRLEQGLGVDWSKFHAIHSAVKPPKPKGPTQVIPKGPKGAKITPNDDRRGYDFDDEDFYDSAVHYKDGVVSVPGPKGAGDVTPAMLTPGEAVIPAEMAKKYAPLINAMIAGNIPGYSRGVKIPAVSSLESMFGQDGSAPTNVSHSKGFSPREFLETARAVTLVSDELRDMRIRVVELTTSVDDSGKKVNTVTERFMTLGEAVERYDPEEHDALAGGKGFGATGLLEGKVRNQRAYTAAGISGGATNLEEVVENGRLAGIELERIGDDGSELANQLRLLTEEGEAARIALSSVDAVQADYNFVMDHATKALEQAALKDTSYKNIQEARNAAAERTAIIQEAYNKVIQNGGTAEEALVAAKLALKEQIFKASKFVQDEALTIGVGPRGTGGGRLRDVMTTRGIKSEDGRVEYANADPNFIGPANKVKVTGGRDNKRVSGMIVRDDVVQSEVRAAEQRALGNLEAVGTTVDQAAAKLVTGWLDRITDAFRKATGMASPAQELINVGSNAGSSLVAGAKEHVDDAKRVGENLGAATVEGAATAAKKIRRASSDPEIQADINKRNQQNTQAARDSANVASGSPRQPRRVTREGDKEIREQEAVGSMQSLGETVSKTKINMDKMMNTASQATMALSSVSGILYMFGGEMQGIAGTVSLVSGGLFALISIVKAYQELMITQKALERFAAVQEAIRLAVTAAATAGTGVFGTAVSVTGAALWAALGPIGLVVAGLALLAGGFMLFNHIAEETRKRVEGLGNAASLSEEKLNFLADKFGVTAKSINWAERNAAVSATSGKSTEEQKQVVDLMIDPEFEKEFASEISGIKNATKEEAQLALESLATQLRNSGFEDEAVSAIISAIAAKAGQTDLELNFKPIFIVDESSANEAANLAKQAIANLNKEVSAQQATVDQKNNDNSAYNDTTLSKSSVEQDLQAAAGVAKSSLDSLTLAFESGNISADVYNKSMSDLFNTLNSAEQPSWMLDSLAEKMGLQDVVKGLTDAADKSLALQAAVAGVEADEDLEIIKEASKEENKNNDELQANAKKARSRITAAITAQTKAQQQSNNATAIGNDLEEQSIESEAIQASITAYHDLVAAGMDAALAYQITGDAAEVAALQKAMDTDATNGNTAALDAFVAARERADALLKERESLKPGGLGGAGQKSAFEEAMEQLKQQQKEAKSSIMAYAKLRSAGMSVAESSEIAKDSILAAALASEQVGSKKWNELVTAIRAARAEEEAWLNTTPEGRAEHFAGVYDKVMDVFSAQQAILEMNNETATASTKKIIESLEKQIEVYQRRSAELERDLEKISEKEDEINKAYDEKTEALETVKKLNQDIINQQKSQLSIADALSRGDISAAASAMQDARAQGAASQGDAMGTALDAARQGELDALTQNGKTRAQIEDEIRQIKKEIEIIEFGALQNARDFVDAADEALDTAIENLRVQGLSKTEWENINTRIQASKANASLYESEVLKALNNARGLVGEWEKLEDTFTTTHVINTIHTTNGSGVGGGTTGDPLDPSLDTPAAQKNRIQKALNNAAHAGKVSSALAVAASATSGTADTRQAKIDYYLAKITKAQADSIFSSAGVTGYSSGGPVSGPGTGTSDSIPARLSKGEYVLKAAAAKKFGRKALDSLNSGRPPQGFSGSMIGKPKLPNPVYTMPERKIPKSNFPKPVFSMPEKEIAKSNFPKPVFSMPEKEIPKSNFPKPAFNMPERKIAPNNFFQPVYSLPEKNYSPFGGAMPIGNQSGSVSSPAPNNNSVYNYSLSVNVSGTNASANDIANVVMNKIKTTESQQVKRQVLR